MSGELAPLVASSFYFSPKRHKKKCTYVRVMRHRNKTCWCHGCAGREKHVAHLDLTVAPTGRLDDGAGRATDAPGVPSSG